MTSSPHSKTPMRSGVFSYGVSFAPLNPFEFGSNINTFVVLTLPVNVFPNLVFVQPNS